MRCRAACGACCIAPSIKQPFYGMPSGKAADVSCVHLDAMMRCALFDDERRPALCDAFVAERKVCGDTREQALRTLATLEVLTMPAMDSAGDGF